MSTKEFKVWSSSHSGPTREMVDVIKLSDHLAAMAEKDAEIVELERQRAYWVDVQYEQRQTIARQAVELAEAREMIEKLQRIAVAAEEWRNAGAEQVVKQEDINQLRRKMFDALNEYFYPELNQKAGAKDE